MESADFRFPRRATDIGHAPELNSRGGAGSRLAAVATAFSLVDDVLTARESDRLTYYQDVFSFFRVLQVAGFNEIGRGEWI